MCVGGVVSVVLGEGPVLACCRKEGSVAMNGSAAVLVHEYRSGLAITMRCLACWRTLANQSRQACTPSSNWRHSLTCPPPLPHPFHYPALEVSAGAQPPRAVRLILALQASPRRAAAKLLRPPVCLCLSAAAARRGAARRCLQPRASRLLNDLPPLWRAPVPDCKLGQELPVPTLTAAAEAGCLTRHLAVIRG